MRSCRLKVRFYHVCRQMQTWPGKGPVYFHNYMIYRVFRAADVERDRASRALFEELGDFHVRGQQRISLDCVRFVH